MEQVQLDFEEIYNCYQTKINNYLTRLAGPKEAEDLTQDVFIKISKSLHTFRNDSQLSTWIYKIATNTYIDKARNTSFKLMQLSDNSYESEYEGCCLEQSESEVEDSIIRNEMKDCIQGYIGTLPDNYQTILILSEFECLSNKEIAHILDISIGTVKVRLHRAKEKLRQILVKKCKFYHNGCSGNLSCEPIGTFPKKTLKLSSSLLKHKNLLHQDTK